MENVVIPSKAEVEAKVADWLLNNVDFACSTKEAPRMSKDVARKLLWVVFADGLYPASWSADEKARYEAGLKRQLEYTRGNQSNAGWMGA